ncbi:fluoride export protein 1 isoform X2 [Quercus suber]|uniref:fluoride export protein 1 isoform X2 n=1 Tax=Quercus suber TaxID=58331 RepID=UPI000CE24695|nr:fluoride export protein 2-like isoform X2 [Quercus suber]POF05132.1 fluoride export protein 1 [Quercus suber]
MDVGTADSEPRRSGSFSSTSSAYSSLRRRSISLSAAAPVHIDDDIESEIVSEAGDIGDRALHSNRHSESSSHRFSVDHALENGVSAPTSGDTPLHLNRCWSRDPPTMTTISVVTPLPEEIISPLSTDAIVCSNDKKQDDKERLPKLLEYALCLIHLAVFGILGVLTRYVLQKLFGPRVAGLTNNENILYLDLPSNMVGSFLMGWWGIIFKADISSVSDYLAIGLTTGYLGSLTTFSGWNQKMLDLIVDGHWVLAVLGFLVGSGTPSSSCNWRVDSFKRHLAVMVVLILMLGLLWGACGALLREEFSSGSSGAQLWLACFVGPPGVWIRWFLARLNGRGLGRAGLFKWVPFGTLAANVSAACIMAALSTVKKAVNSQTCDTVVLGIQLGFLGCLSTVSTFIAEFNAMRESERPWRAYAYALITICISFGLGILIYSVPVWTKGYG